MKQYICAKCGAINLPTHDPRIDELRSIIGSACSVSALDSGDIDIYRWNNGTHDYIILDSRLSNPTEFHRAVYELAKHGWRVGKERGWRAHFKYIYHY